MALPSASIVIVTFNGRELLDHCLVAVLPEAIPIGAELIVVDNGSSDGTVAFLSARYPQIRVVASNRNLGFAEGCNLGVRHALAERIVLLNNDAVPAAGWLRGLLAAVDEPAVAVACSVVHDDGFAEAYALGTGSLSVVGHPVPGANPSGEPFYATGSSLAFRRSLLGEPFDPDYFAYYEDVLLSWCARLRGFRVARAFNSHVRHRGGATAQRNRPLAAYYYERNKLLTLLLTYEVRTLARLVPLYMFDGLVRAIEDASLIVRQSDWTFGRLQWTAHRYALILRGIAWIVVHLRTVRAKRRAIQQNRKLPDSALIGLLSGKIFDDVVASRLHHAANWLAMAYCRLVGLRTIEGRAGPGPRLTSAEIVPRSPSA